MSSRRQRGRQSQRQGAAFELRVKAEAEAAGVLLHKVPTSAQPLRRLPGNPRLMVCRLETPTAPDWLGSFRGRSLALEAKTTTHDKRWSLGDRLAGHQGDALAAYHADGGVAAVLVCRLGEGAVDHYLLPWPEADPRPERKSWRWEQIERWRVPVGASWTDVLGRWEGYLDKGWEVGP